MPRGCGASMFRLVLEGFYWHAQRKGYAIRWVRMASLAGGLDGVTRDFDTL